MSFRSWRRVLVLGLLSIAVMAPGFAPRIRAQQESTREEDGRKVQTRVAPTYPDLARRMKISGTVKVQVMVAPNGTVKDTKIVGGHPLLANAVIDAVRKWHYEARSQASTETLEFRFDPTQ
ncbi:MAG: energy transducer TonB [Terriglobales bacterium]